METLKWMAWAREQVSLNKIFLVRRQFLFQNYLDSLVQKRFDLIFYFFFKYFETAQKKNLDPKRAKELVEEIFTTKLLEKEEEIDLISQRIKEVQHSLQMVRYGAVSAMSNQTQIHVRFFSQ